MSPSPDVRARVLAAVELVPPGRVVTYGDIGHLAGLSARQVGAILRGHGSGVPWWRVVNASGSLGPWERALAHWRREGIALRADGEGCRIAAHRADLGAWASDYAALALASGWPPPD